ncbi:MAG: DHH family phosphoesterase [Candidatus Pacearchaeota archaeon]
MKNDSKGPSKKFDPKKKGFNKPDFKPKKAFAKDISSDLVGKTLYLEGIIDGVNQTEGPTLFTFEDGTGSFKLEAFLEAGKRAHEEIEEGDVVSAEVKVKEYQGMYEGEILKINKLEGDKKQEVLDTVNEKKRERAQPPQTEFLVKSEILDKLHDRFVKAATEIRMAILENRPIIVRHHNDADGYSSGYTLERAIVPLLKQQHDSEKAAWEFFTRAPCTAPFYEIDDSIRDSSMALRNFAKFSNKMPLVIIADNGSSEEDLMPIQQGKIHGMDFIVIDHHYFEEDVISNETLAHINPHLNGDDGNLMSAGMLCTEIARFINPEVENIFQIPAMAGLADRIGNEEVMKQYMDIAEKEGYEKEVLGKIEGLIEFVSAKLKFLEAREYIEVLFGEPRDQQKKLVELMAPYIEKLEQTGLEMAKSAVVTEKLGNVNFQTLQVEQDFPGFGFYPKPGRTIGMLQDYSVYDKGMENVITAGILSSAITIRVSDDVNFSIHELLEFLKEQVPEAFIKGGGHKNAGSLNFIPNSKDKVVSKFKEYIQIKNS